MASFEVADVFRQFAPAYLDAFGERLLPSHRRAIEDIQACRTPALGGHVYRCADCDTYFHVYHACRNRACPACHTRQTGRWFEARQRELLPCSYYHVVVTVPKGLRDLLRANQKTGYGVLMKASAEAVKRLCQDPRYMRATPAILAVLHTWTAAMDYHPHVHLLISAGGIGRDGTSWHEARHRFLVPVRALSRLVRRLFREALPPELETEVPREVWGVDWVVWCKPWGEGETGVLDYLARYVHRIAITNRRILAVDEHTVTFRYKDRKAGRWRTRTIPGIEFMRRFLQHVLPKGFHKVRFYGLWHCARRAQRQSIRTMLLLSRPAVKTDGTPRPAPSAFTARNPAPSTMCPRCRSERVEHLGPLLRQAPKAAPRASPETVP